MRLLLFLPLFLLSPIASQRFSPPGYKNWKCTSSLRYLGGNEYIYRDLINSTCANLKDSLNQCCENFNECEKGHGLFCVEEHEKCNAKVISGREKECSSFSNKLIRQDKRRFPEEGWECHASTNPGAWEQNFRVLMDSSCANLKDSFNKCCATFNVCNRNKEFNCVEKHEECNENAISDRKLECSTIANRFIEHDQRRFPDKNWKCLAPKDRLGGADNDYRTLVQSQYCAQFKDSINQCCIDFNDCSSRNEFNCVEEQEKCNANVISGRHPECSSIVDSFIRKDLRRLPDKDWKCKGNGLLGSWEANYRKLIKGKCANLKDGLNLCCISFNNCDSKNGFKCVEEQEECNARVISGHEQDCSAIANSFIQQDRRRLPDNKWKCRSPKGRLGGWEQDYRTLIKSQYCADFKDGLNQCCVNFNDCSRNKGSGCVENHKSCNSRIISGREKECSPIANKFIQEEESDETSYRVVIYFKQVIMYTKEQIRSRPIQSWIIISLLLLVLLGFVCGVCCICCTVLSKGKKKSEHRISSSKASSVRSNSFKD